MYAIIESGGKQNQVAKNHFSEVETHETKAGEKVEFKHVLFVNDAGAVKIGNPHIAKSSVQAELMQEVKGPKEVAFKYKQRKPFRRKVGHRQRYARVKITEIIG